MANGKIIIISTHIVSDIEYISDQILIMKKGRLILQGSAEKLLPEVDGMVWNVTIPQNEWIHFEAHNNIVNSHNQGTVIEVEANPFVGTVISAETSSGEIYFDREYQFKPAM